MFRSGAIVIASLLGAPGVAGLAGPAAPGGCALDRSRCAILPPGDPTSWREDLRTSEYPLTTADLEQAECLLIERAEVVNAGLEQEGAGEHIEVGEYYRQYCVLRDQEGHRILFLNAFCSRPSTDAWRSAWVQVEDGGACYFQALFDLTSGTVLEFIVNGEA